MPTFNTFDGVNNLGQEHALQPNVLREAVNVDLTNEKKLRTRGGFSEPVIACQLGHSFYTHDFLPFALFADGDTLFAMHGDETAEQLATGIAPGLPISYEVINDGVYWSNGIQRGFVSAVLEVMDWACPDPQGQPSLAAIAGAFAPGRIKVAVTHVDARGRESGTTLAAELEVPASGGVRLTAIPQPIDANVMSVRVYASNPNDEILYHHATLSVGTLTCDVTSPPEGRSLTTQSLRAMPAGHIVRELGGRLIVAVGRRILWSPALRFGLFDPSRDWVALPERIDMMEPVGSGKSAGMWVGAGGKTYYLSGSDPRDWEPLRKSPYGVVPGSSARMSARMWGIESDESVAAWQARNGYIVLGLPGGQMTTHNVATAVSGVGERAAAIFREADGLYQFIVAQTATSQPRVAVQDKVSVRTYHHDGRVS